METLSLLLGDHIFCAMDKKQITAMVLFVNYKIWVPPTKLFFGSKVILQTDNGPRVHGIVLLNNHEILRPNINTVLCIFH